MRIPRPMHGHRWDYWFKRLWNLYVRNIKIQDCTDIPDMPPETKIIDALEFVKRKPQKVQFPAPYRKESKYLDTEENPDWKSQVLHYSRDTLIFDGHVQLLSLFKTVSYEGLASSVKALVGKHELQNADEILSRRILHDFVWDSTQIKLPARMDPANHRRRVPREFGIPLGKKVLSLEKQLVNLCAMAVGPPSCQQHMMTSPFAKVFFEKGDERILSEFVGDSVLLGKTALGPFDPSPSSTAEKELIDIYPLSPTIDLTPLHIYEDLNQFCVKSNGPKRFCHTLLISHNIDKHWKLKQKLARGIGGCFTFAASQATQLFGPSVKDLPEPVALNCILVDEKTVTLLSYQLNTLDLDGREGVKNQVWIDGPHQLFESYDRDSGLVGYNPDVFPKVLALYLNGINL